MGEIIEVVQPASEEAKIQKKQPTPRQSPKWEADARDRIKAAMKKYGKALTSIIDADANEADTRLFVTDFLCDGLGFDKYTELSTEYRVKNEYADYGIRLDKDLVAFVEVKRINTKLGPKHLRQVQAYAVNEGVEWMILTNGAQWQVYHLGDKIPAVVDLAMSIDLVSEESPSHKANQMFYLSRESFKRRKLDELWQAKRATSPKSLSGILLSPAVVDAVRKELKKTTGYSVDAAEVSRLLRETCIKPECFEK